MSILKETTAGSVMSLGETDEEKAVIQSILSSGLYARPMEAVIREYVANGRDAIVAAGKDLAEHPVHIQLPNRENDWTLTITDEGTGMSREALTKRYTGFSLSDKRGDDKATGELGMGSKSGFAVADQITITSTQNGLSTIVVLGATGNGLKRHDELFHGPTDRPDGTVVSLQARSGWREQEKWIVAARRALTWTPAQWVRVEDDKPEYHTERTSLRENRPIDNVPAHAPRYGMTELKPAVGTILERAVPMEDVFRTPFVKWIYAGEGVWFSFDNHSNNRNDRIRQGVVMNNVFYEGRLRSDKNMPYTMVMLLENKALPVHASREYIDVSPEVQTRLAAHYQKGHQVIQKFLQSLMDHVMQSPEAYAQNADIREILAKIVDEVELRIGPTTAQKIRLNDSMVVCSVSHYQNHTTGQPQMRLAGNYPAGYETLDALSDTVQIIVENVDDLEDEDQVRKVGKDVVSWIRMNKDSLIEKTSTPMQKVRILLCPGTIGGWSPLHPRHVRVNLEEVIGSTKAEAAARRKKTKKLNPLEKLGQTTVSIEHLIKHPGGDIPLHKVNVQGNVLQEHWNLEINDLIALYGDEMRRGLVVVAHEENHDRSISGYRGTSILDPRVGHTWIVYTSKVVNVAKALTASGMTVRTVTKGVDGAAILNQQLQHELGLEWKPELDSLISQMMIASMELDNTLRTYRQGFDQDPLVGRLLLSEIRYEAHYRPYYGFRWWNSRNSQPKDHMRGTFEEVPGLAEHLPLLAALVREIPLLVTYHGLKALSPNAQTAEIGAELVEALLEKRRG